MTPWARRRGDRWVLELRVQPGASTTEVVGELGDRLKVRVAAPPADGRANAELVRFLADTLGVSRSEVEITRGQASRSKSVRVPADVDLRSLFEH